MVNNQRLVKLSLNIANWCRDSNLEISELNINRYLAMRALSLSKVEIMMLYDGMLPHINPYDLVPVTIHRKKSPKYWVPSKSNPAYVISRVSGLGSTSPRIDMITPNALSQYLVDEHERKMKDEEAALTI